MYAMSIEEPVQCIRYDDSLWNARSGVRIPVGAADYLFPKTVQSGYKAHIYCYSMGKGFFPGGKEAESCS
jgi:hypothetical protein